MFPGVSRLSITARPLEMAMSVNVDLREQLRELEVEGVEETDKELGRGAYGVVVELKVNGLRYITINSAALAQ